MTPDRETYMEEYRLTPDELTAKAFRVIQSSRRGYYPNGKSEWIAAVKKVYKRDGKVFAGISVMRVETFRDAVEPNFRKKPDVDKNGLAKYNTQLNDDR